jgi:hypothetical protein
MIVDLDAHHRKRATELLVFGVRPLDLLLSFVQDVRQRLGGLVEPGDRGGEVGATDRQVQVSGVHP